MNKYKENKNAKKKEKLVKQYKNKLMSLKKFIITSIVIMIFILLLFFVRWSAVDNKDYGIEVSVNGYSYILAGLTHNYSSSSEIYGDLAVPFYYYAQSDVESLSLVSLLSFISIILSIVIFTLGTFKPNKYMYFSMLILSIINTVFLFVCFGVAKNMTNANILSVYCGGNPACTIVSYSIIPALLSIIVILLSLIIVYREMQYRKELKTV